MAVFLCYHQSRLETVEHVANYLGRHGVEAWYAPRDVPPGAEWDHAIYRAIRDSDALVLLFDSSADGSRHVKREIKIADSAEIPIRWLRLEDIEPDKLGYFLGTLQWIDWLDRRDDALDRLVRSLKLSNEARQVSVPRMSAEASSTSTPADSVPATRGHERGVQSPQQTIPTSGMPKPKVAYAQPSVDIAQSETVRPSQNSGDWTRKTFVAAVEDPTDAAFLQRLLELLDANAKLPRLGSHSRFYFGKRPSGGMFIYPYGLRHPPFQLAISSRGELTIRGCWRGFPKVRGHAGFAELAAMLDQDEGGAARFVPVAGLDPDALWEVGVKVARAINS